MITLSIKRPGPIDPEAYGRTYWRNDGMNQYPRAKNVDERLEQVGEEVANIVASSRLENGLHSPVLDIDYQAALVPSSTSGHFHLYLNGVSMPWWKYRILLKAMAFCGVIEKGYYRHSVRRQMTCVRMPHVSKVSKGY